MKTFLCVLILWNALVGTKSQLDVNARDNDGNTALHIGVIYGRTEISELLVQWGKADVNIANNKGQVPLHTAVDLQRIQIMKMLVRNDASLDVQDKDGNTPLHLALLNGIKNSNVILPECGFNFNEEKEDGKSFAYIACFLVVHGANLNIKNNKGQIPLNLCKSLKSCNAQNPIYRNWDIDTKDNDGNTALHTASIMNRIEISQILVNHGANMNLINYKEEQTPLHIAVDLRHIEIVKILVSNNCNLTIQDKDGNTPLHVAIKFYLNAEPRNSFCNSKTAVSTSELTGYPYIICYLVEHDANWTIKNKKKKTPIELCPGLRNCVKI